MTGGREAEIAAVLAEIERLVREYGASCLPTSIRYPNARETAQEILTAVAAAVRAEPTAVLAAQPETHTDREIAAAALRDAAEDGPSSTPTDQLWRMWLRDRADRIDNPGGRP